MGKIELTPDEAQKYSYALADIICFMWGYASNMEKDFNPYYKEWMSILEDLRQLRRKLTKGYRIEIKEA